MTDFWQKPEATEDANLKDWLAYLKNKPDIEDVRTVIYKFSASDMQEVRAFVANGATVPSEWQKNSLLKYWKNDRNVEDIDYLFYAKQCETQAGDFQNKWDAKEGKREADKMKFLADAGKQYYKEKASNDFLKLRFAYQAVRMAQYSGQHQKGITLYDELVKPLEAKTESPIKYWALAHKAGCLAKAGKENEANYLFAQIYEKCPSKRVSSALSWNVTDEAAWKGTSALCQNPQEQAALHFIRAVRENGDMLAEMKNIYEKAPDYDKLYILLLSEINSLENALMQSDTKESLWFLGKTGESSPEEAAKKLHKLRAFTTKCVAEGKVQKKEVFALASGHLDFLAGNSPQALKKLDELSKQTKDPIYTKQIEICKLAIQVAGLTKIDEVAETELFNAVKKTEKQELENFMWAIFNKLYTKQNEVGKAQMCEFIEIRYNPLLPVLDQLVPVAENKKQTPAIQYLLEKNYGKDALNVLREIKATVLFREEKLKEAVALYEQIPVEKVGKLKENPLGFSIQDNGASVDGTGKNKYNRMTLAYKIINLKKMVETPNIDQAQQYFQLGCIYYNMTIFGNSWYAIDYYTSSYDLAGKYQRQGKVYDYVNDDTNKAKYYFEKAMNTAMKDQDRELGAQAAYMAAKCEQNEYYIKMVKEPKPDYPEVTLDPQYRRYFATLKKDFSKTKYYQEILKECSYFNMFLKKK